MTTISLHSERTYRHAYVGLSALSGLALAALIVAGYPLLGVGVFVACFFAVGALHRTANRPLFDERDRQQHYRAAGRTLMIFGWASAAFFPSLTALVALEYYTWPAWLTPIAFFIPMLYGTFGAFLLVDRWV